MLSSSSTVNTHLGVLRQVEDSVQPLCVVMSGLFLVGHIPVSLWQCQKPPDGAQVVPQGAVLWAGVLLPPKQFTEPALRKKNLSVKIHY